MPENQTSTTELTSQYVAQVTGDLERNVKEQERIAADIASLQERLLALQHDRKVLVTMREALGGGRPAAAETATAVPSVPKQKKAPAATAKKTPAKKTTTSRKTTAARKTSAAKEAAGKGTSDKGTAGKKSAGGKDTGGKDTGGKPAAKTPGIPARPSLVDLIRTHLEEQKEPRSAAEIATALTAAHPDRTIRTTVVRTSLENLVARSSAHRNKQGTSVFYTAATGPAAEPAAATTA
ncbi:hypothetical protein [Streptomyces beigongshangae]|uniref:hypothetical protein n=1 Tax=Streptomyces beigongshangae TaxID=2841597 RepID=UPI001C85A166|nr:hypothetical protein [Streptomyces sp. REN17]